MGKPYVSEHATFPNMSRSVQGKRGTSLRGMGYPGKKPGSICFQKAWLTQTFEQNQAVMLSTEENTTFEAPTIREPLACQQLPFQKCVSGEMLQPWMPCRAFVCFCFWFSQEGCGGWGEWLFSSSQTTYPRLFLPCPVVSNLTSIFTWKPIENSFYIILMLQLQPRISHITPSHHANSFPNSIPKGAIQRNTIWTIQRMIHVYSHRQEKFNK